VSPETRATVVDGYCSRPLNSALQAFRARAWGTSLPEVAIHRRVEARYGNARGPPHPDRHPSREEHK
jgi:hypothetical protein